MGNPLADQQRLTPPTASWPDGTRVWLIDPSLVHNDTLARGVGWLDADESAVTSPLAALGEALDRIERRIEHLERRGEHGGPDASSDERSP